MQHCFHSHLYFHYLYLSVIFGFWAPKSICKRFRLWDAFLLSLSLWLQQQLSQLSTPFLLLCQREHSRGSSTTGGCTHSRPMQGNEEEAPASAAPRECFGIRWGGNPTPARPKGLQSKPLLRRRPDLSWFCPQWMPPPRDLHPFCLLQTTWSHFLPHLEPFLICLAELQARLGYMAQLERCMWGRRLPVSLTYQKPFVTQVSSCPASASIAFQFLQTPPENDLFIQEKTFSHPQLKYFRKQIISCHCKSFWKKIMTARLFRALDPWSGKGVEVEGSLLCDCGDKLSRWDWRRLPRIRSAIIEPISFHYRATERHCG